MMNLKYFNLSEFDCPCCGLNNMDIDFLEDLDVARAGAGVPFKIHSGYRCLIHNGRVGGKPKSAHIYGLAADIGITNSRNRFKIVNSLIVVGFHRLGIGSDFIHVDNDKSKDPAVMWLY